MITVALAELRVSEATKEMTNHVIKLSEHRKPSHLPRCCCCCCWPNSQHFRVLTAGRPAGGERRVRIMVGTRGGGGGGETGAVLLGEMFEHPRENILGVSTHKLPMRDTQ